MVNEMWPQEATRLQRIQEIQRVQGNTIYSDLKNLVKNFTGQKRRGRPDLQGFREILHRIR